jgi:D-alanyl-D-alanine carboxypeptidase (penicillin-binding protein 5/6)
VRLAATRFVSAVVVSLCALVIAAFSAPGASATRAARKAQPPNEDPTQTAQAACQGRQVPPPPIHTSEEPEPGQPSPEPLPIPEDPIGGSRMGECGMVLPEGAAEPPMVAAAAWLISDLDTGAVLAAKEPHARERPASLIKNLLAVVVIRELSPDTMVVGTQEDADQEGTKVGIGPGGEYTVDQLLHALIMKSGNDAAWALARALGGVDVALEKMNAIAVELGALDTRAATPSGLDGPGMTTSAYDQSLIFRAAMAHEEFAEAATTRSIEFPGYGDKAGFTITNDSPLLRDYEGFLGGKTGYTTDARHTYAGAAERDGRRLAVVLMRGEKTPAETLGEQGALLLDYGFGLAEAETKAVGELVSQSPEAQPKQDSNQSDTVRRPVTEAADASDTAQERSMFGNVGLPLVVLAGLAVLAAMALWLRRRRARANRG